KQRIVLIKIAPLEPEPTLASGGFLVSYKVRPHDIEVVKIPRAKDNDETWKFLALHLEARSQALS
ncbi:MAG TPA: hypothetical protein VMU59_01040, partial [Caulobacteraceae bacterium]|nr:hypothetical protein [Caulobacteraceae bacterium]